MTLSQYRFLLNPIPLKLSISISLSLSLSSSLSKLPTIVSGRGEDTFEILFPIFHHFHIYISRTYIVVPRRDRLVESNYWRLCEGEGGGGVECFVGTTILLGFTRLFLIKSTARVLILKCTVVACLLEQ